MAIIKIEPSSQTQLNARGNLSIHLILIIGIAISVYYQYQLSFADNDMNT